VIFALRFRHGLTPGLTSAVRTACVGRKETRKIFR
jgi:hypothetical protein